MIKISDSFQFSVNIISRGKGKIAVASAAYISGEKIKNEWDGVTHDYTRKE
ncbi:MAG: MobA/MobL family protein [Finegoldia magna]|nr:MobA/MobL family protein [Finegoldia magna]MDU2220424.1 MobA/MobL family protein [Finegoldia magna]